MNKLLGALMALGAVGGLVYVLTIPKSGSDSGSFSNLSAKDLTIRSIAKGNETDYDIRMAVGLQQAKEPLKSVVTVDGTLTESLNAAQDYVTAWKNIRKFRLDGHDLRADQIASLVGKKGVSTLQGKTIQHYLSQDFPRTFLRIHTGILDRMFLPLATGGAGTVLNEEKEESNVLNAEYAYSKDGELTVITKKWLSYKNPSIKIDPKFNNIVYYFDKTGMLLGAQGILKIYYSLPADTLVVVDFWTKAIDTQSLASPNFIDRSALKLVDDQTKAAADASAVAGAGATFEEAMKNVDTITDKMDSRAYYNIFMGLTAQVRANPDVAAEVEKKILASTGRDPSTRRKLSAMFGALAESKSPAVADTLAELADKCPDNYCKVQAIMGVNTHSAPSPTNVKSMMDIARKSPDYEVSQTALIAAGAVASKMENGAPDMPKEMLQIYNDPNKANIKSSTLAAMGNHGSADYLPVLTKELKNEDSSVRASAVYSLRNIPGDGVNDTIVKVIQNDASTSVVAEALKAMGYRKMTTEQYTQIAIRVASYPNRDLEEQAANVMMDVYRANPEVGTPAINILKEKAKYPSVKAYIEEQLKLPYVDPNQSN
ncbi:MAG: HEAT repeat domain-containing protein [Chitinophagaceae bacterium]|nr:HEAT repeat domain-containing protein [Oligoflexus sp.]